MMPLLEIPEIVAHYAPFYADVFSEPAFAQFQRYVTGLIVSENKTVEGINRLFVLDMRAQSSLNRFLNRSPFSVERLNQARLRMLQAQPETRLKRRGVLSVDDTLLPHYGKHFEHIAKLYDPAEQRYVWAHNLVNLHYSDAKTDYPIAFRLWKPADLERIEAGLRAAGVRLRDDKLVLKREQPKKWRQYLLALWKRKQKRPGVKALYASKLTLAEQLLTRFVADYPELYLPICFDTWYTWPAFCRYIDQVLKRPYVGTLAAKAQLVLGTGKERVDAFAARLKQEHHAAVQAGHAPVFGPLTIPYKGASETYYSYCRVHRLVGYGKQRLVINHRRRDLSDPPAFFITNRLRWQARGITRIRRYRWSVEVYHEEGKSDGLAQYQVRGFEAIYRHIAMVAVVYSILRAAQHDGSLLKRLRRQLGAHLEGTLGQWRRTTQAEGLWRVAVFVAVALEQGQSLQEALRPLLQLFSY